MCYKGGGKSHIFVKLTPDDFDLVRAKFGRARRVGRKIRDVCRSWTYIHAAWDNFARPHVTSAIESAAGGDHTSVVAFNLFGDGSKIKKEQKQQPNKNNSKKNKNKSKVCLMLPDCFDAHVHKVAALVDHFTRHQEQGTRKCSEHIIEYAPSQSELQAVVEVLKKVVADPATGDLSAPEIYQQCILDAGLLDTYRGAGWKQWCITQLELIQQQPAPPAPLPNAIKPDASDSACAFRRELKQHGANSIEMVHFMENLSRLVLHKRSVGLLVEQWCNSVAKCSSHWCPPPLWWCVASTVVGNNLVGMTRADQESQVSLPATCLENWDVLALLKLLRSSVFSNKVNAAAGSVLKYTRTDLAHERFDCDWNRDWNCMAELLDALGLATDSDNLREFCKSKNHRIDTGERCNNARSHDT